jgi:hypothetical protein
MDNPQTLNTVVISLIMIGVFGYEAWNARPTSSNPSARRGRFTTSLALVAGAAILVIGKLSSAPPPSWLMSLVLLTFLVGSVWEYRETRASREQEESAPRS